MSNKLLTEGLHYQDMKGLVKPTLHIDEFASKMGDDADICVLSFYSRGKNIAKDLVEWFEKGYDFVLDSETSAGEIKPNRYLTYVEIKRRTSVPDWIEELLGDLCSLTEHTLDDWVVTYQNNNFAYNKDEIKKRVLLSPQAYREFKDRELNEMVAAAGLEPNISTNTDPAVRQFVSAAGL